MNRKQKLMIKIQQNNLDIFTNQILFKSIDYFFIYKNQDVASKRFKTKRSYLRKGIIDNYNAIINAKNFHNQPIDSNMKRHKEIRKLTLG